MKALSAAVFMLMLVSGIVNVMLAIQNKELKHSLTKVKVYDIEKDMVRSVYVDEEGTGIIILKHLGEGKHMNIRVTINHKLSEKILEMYQQYQTNHP